MAVYAIGDVQGCYDELRRLLDAIAFDPATDRVWFTGDLVNRGPQSLSVLRFVRGLGAAAISVLGNHDLHALALAYEIPAALRIRHTLDGLLRASDRDELIDWLRRRPIVHHDKKRGLLVHAGLAPGWDIPLANKLAREIEATLCGSGAADLLATSYRATPRRWRSRLSAPDRQLFALSCFTRIRHIHPDGRLNHNLKGPPETKSNGDLPWFRYPGRCSADTRIVFGHWAALGLLVEPTLVCADTGCVWGQYLSAVQIRKRRRPRLAAQVRAGASLRRP